MKKITYLLCLMLLFSSLSACKNIGDQNASLETSQTLQAENPPEETVCYVNYDNHSTNNYSASHNNVTAVTSDNDRCYCTNICGYKTGTDDYNNSKSDNH